MDEKRYYEISRSLRWPEGTHCLQGDLTHYWTDNFDNLVVTAYMGMELLTSSPILFASNM